jgi:hypothetical protein
MKPLTNYSPPDLQASRALVLFNLYVCGKGTDAVVGLHVSLGKKFNDALPGEYK